jgi:hypothetical protein
MDEMELRSDIISCANEPKLTNIDEVQKGISVGKATDPSGLPNRALNHLLHLVVFLVVQIFNAILLTHHFPCGSRLG